MTTATITKLKATKEKVQETVASVAINFQQEGTAIENLSEADVTSYLDRLRADDVTNAFRVGALLWTLFVGVNNSAGKQWFGGAGFDTLVESRFGFKRSKAHALIRLYRVLWSLPIDWKDAAEIGRAKLSACCNDFNIDALNFSEKYRSRAHKVLSTRVDGAKKMSLRELLSVLDEKFPAPGIPTYGPDPAQQEQQAKAQQQEQEKVTLATEGGKIVIATEHAPGGSDGGTDNAGALASAMPVPPSQGKPAHDALMAKPSPALPQKVKASPKPELTEAEKEAARIEDDAGKLKSLGIIGNIDDAEQRTYLRRVFERAYPGRSAVIVRTKPKDNTPEVDPSPLAQAFGAADNEQLRDYIEQDADEHLKSIIGDLDPDSQEYFRRVWRKAFPGWRVVIFPADQCPGDECN